MRKTSRNTYTIGCGLGGLIWLILFILIVSSLCNIQGLAHNIHDVSHIVQYGE